MPAVSDKFASNHLSKQQIQQPACSVCWADFDHLMELENHARTCHPDRICKQEELYAFRAAA